MSKPCKRIIDQHRLVVFLLQDCPYCKGLVHAFQRADLDKALTKVYVSPERKLTVQRELMVITGTHTFPQLFYEGEYQGGYTENNQVRDLVKKYGPANAKVATESKESIIRRLFSNLFA